MHAAATSENPQLRIAPRGFFVVVDAIKTRPSVRQHFSKTRPHITRDILIPCSRSSQVQTVKLLHASAALSSASANAPGQVAPPPVRVACHLRRAWTHRHCHLGRGCRARLAQRAAVLARRGEGPGVVRGRRVGWFVHQRLFPAVPPLPQPHVSYTNRVPIHRRGSPMGVNASRAMACSQVRSAVGLVVTKPLRSQARPPETWGALRFTRPRPPVRPSTAAEATGGGISIPHPRCPRSRSRGYRPSRRPASGRGRGRVRCPAHSRPDPAVAARTD